MPTWLFYPFVCLVLFVCFVSLRSLMKEQSSGGSYGAEVQNGFTHIPSASAEIIKTTAGYNHASLSHLIGSLVRQSTTLHDRTGGQESKSGKVLKFKPLTGIAFLNHTILVKQVTQLSPRYKRKRHRFHLLIRGTAKYLQLNLIHHWDKAVKPVVHLKLQTSVTGKRQKTGGGIEQKVGMVLTGQVGSIPNIKAKEKNHFSVET